MTRVYGVKVKTFRKRNWFFKGKVYIVFTSRVLCVDWRSVRGEPYFRQDPLFSAHLSTVSPVNGKTTRVKVEEHPDLQKGVNIILFKRN